MLNTEEKIEKIIEYLNDIKEENKRLTLENTEIKDTFIKVLKHFGDSNLKKSFTVNDNEKTEIKGYKLVDLGLPSGTLWMDRNVGASSPSDYGLYFAWGETDGYTADEVGNKKQFSWDDYKYANGEYDKLTKYCTYKEYGYNVFTDNLNHLKLADDIVYKYTNGECNMSTKAQLQELLDNTTSEWTTQDGVNGRLFTSKTNGNSIFVPAAGFGGNGSVYNVGSIGYLWSSSLGEDGPSSAWYLYFFSSSALIYDNYRCLGLSVRGVVAASK